MLLEFKSPNSITKYSQMPYLKQDAVLYTFYSAIGIWKYPSHKSNLEKYLAPYSLLKSTSKHDKGYESMIVFLFNAL